MLGKHFTELQPQPKETELGFPQQRGFKEKWSHRGNETLGRELWISV